MNSAKPITAYDVIVRKFPLPIIDNKPDQTNWLVRMVRAALIFVARSSYGRIIHHIFKQDLLDARGRRIDPSVTIVDAAISPRGTHEMRIIPFGHSAIYIRPLKPDLFSIRIGEGKQEIMANRNDLPGALGSLIAA